MSSIQQASNLLTWFCVLFEGLRVLVGMGFLTHHMLAYPAWPTRTVTLCYIVEKRDKQSQGSYGEKAKVSGLKVGSMRPIRNTLKRQGLSCGRRGLLPSPLFGFICLLRESTSTLRIEPMVSGTLPCRTMGKMVSGLE